MARKVRINKITHKVLELQYSNCLWWAVTVLSCCIDSRGVGFCLSYSIVLQLEAQALTLCALVLSSQAVHCCTSRMADAYSSCSLCYLLFVVCSHSTIVHNKHSPVINHIILAPMNKPVHIWLCDLGAISIVSTRHKGRCCGTLTCTFTLRTSEVSLMTKFLPWENLCCPNVQAHREWKTVPTFENHNIGTECELLLITAVFGLVHVCLAVCVCTKWQN